MKRSVFIGLSLIPVSLILLGTVFVKEKIFQAKALPVIGDAPRFELVDSNAQTFSSEELKDKVWVADFIFTTCAGPCPVMTQNLAWIHRSYVLEQDVKLITITVNPDYDSPQVLKNYSQKHDANTNAWYFLTGPKEKIFDVAYKGFKLGDGENPIFHSPKMALVDKEGKIRGYYTGTEDEEIRRLFKDIARLL